MQGTTYTSRQTLGFEYTQKESERAMNSHSYTILGSSYSWNEGDGKASMRAALFSHTYPSVWHCLLVMEGTCSVRVVE